jgi:hypothetical protein
MTPRELLGWLELHVPTAANCTPSMRRRDMTPWEMTRVIGYVHRALHEMAHPEPRALDPETAERKRRLTERRDALADELYLELMECNAGRTVESDPTGVYRQIQRERDEATKPLHVRIEALLDALREMRHHGDTWTSIRATKAMNADMAAASNTSGRSPSRGGGG